MMTTTTWSTSMTMLALLAGAARAEVGGSSDGQLVAKKLAQPVAAAAALVQSGPLVTGTLALGGDAPLAGAYRVQGRATPKRVKLKGAANGVSLTWTAKVEGETLQGRARLKGAGVKAVGTLMLTHNPPLGDGSACDGVFATNETFFTTQVLGTALVTCAACHVSGGQAEATRFRVGLSDALATARSVAPLVDSAHPDDSRILAKPLALVPHGGGAQIVTGSSAEQTLRQWVGMIAAAHCD